MGSVGELVRTRTTVKMMRQMRQRVTGMLKVYTGEKMRRGWGMWKMYNVHRGEDDGGYWDEEGVHRGEDEEGLGDVKLGRRVTGMWKMYSVHRGASQQMWKPAADSILLPSHFPT